MGRAEGPWNYVVEKLKETESGLEEENWINTVVDKLKEWLVVVEDFFESLIGKADEVFPPDTRGDQISHWLHVAAPYLIPTAALFVFVCFIRSCCCRGGRVRMMKAPGRYYMLPRHTFESNPGSYFRGLRGKSSLVELT